MPQVDVTVDTDSEYVGIDYDGDGFRWFTPESAASFAALLRSAGDGNGAVAAEAESEWMAEVVRGFADDPAGASRLADAIERKVEEVR